MLFYSNGNSTVRHHSKKQKLNYILYKIKLHEEIRTCNDSFMASGKETDVSVRAGTAPK